MFRPLKFTQGIVQMEAEASSLEKNVRNIHLIKNMIQTQQLTNVGAATPDTCHWTKVCDVKSITGAQILLLTLTGELNSILNSFCCDGHSLMLYTETRWALTPTFAREELMVLQPLNCEISSLISSISSVLQCRLQTGLVPYCWGCLTLPITRACVQLLRALPSFNHLDLNSSCWVCASGWIHFRKCQPKSENICIKKIWQPVCEWFFCPLYFAGRVWHLAGWPFCQGWTCTESL